MALCECTLTRASSEELRLRSSSCLSGFTRLSTRQTHARTVVSVPLVEDGHVGPQKDVPEDPEGSFRLRDIQGLEAQQAEANIALKNLQGDNTGDIVCHGVLSLIVPSTPRRGRGMFVAGHSATSQRCQPCRDSGRRACVGVFKGSLGYILKPHRRKKKGREEGRMKEGRKEGAQLVKVLAAKSVDPSSVLRLPHSKRKSVPLDCLLTCTQVPAHTK